MCAASSSDCDSAGLTAWIAAIRIGVLGSTVSGAGSKFSIVGSKTSRMSLFLAHVWHCDKITVNEKRLTL